MLRLTRWFLLLALAAPAALAQPATAPTSAPIFDYVNTPDAAYHWEKVSETQAATGCKLTTLMLTSQVWQGLTWTHQLAIIQPVEMKTPSVAILLINGGRLGDRELGMLSLLAMAASAPIVYLGDIPNQPLFGNLREDALIAYTIKKYLETRDATWPLLFPMTKSAVRAMDAVCEYTKQAWPQGVQKFVVTGASKRGWTTYFTGEADPGRVAGIAPIIYDNLNLPAQMRHQKECYGTYSSQIEDYTELGLPELVQTPFGAQVGAMIDPYSYRDRLTMPKLLIHGTNDPYWVVDSANIYFDELPGAKYLLYQPNAGHTISDLGRFAGGLSSFYMLCAGSATFPQFNWHFQRDADGLKLGMITDQQPKRVLQWTATSPIRDFRQAKWESRALEQAGGQWLAQVGKPATGYAAMFGEVVCDISGREAPLCTTIEVIGGP